MTGDVTTGNHNLSLKLTIRLSSSTRFDIGSCGSITPSSTIQHVKTIISQREESDNCAVERQRLIYKGRILSDNARTLADYGIGAGDSSGGGADGIIIYLVKGALNTGAAGGAGGAATAATNSAPAPATTNAAPTQPNPMSNPFMNFGAPPATGGNNAANPMANLMNSMGGMGAGGGMPDMATFQQEMMNNPQMMQEMMNNPMVQSIMNNPDFMRSMMENNPQMRQVLETNPELRHALEDPELMRRSMEMMRDPSAMQNMMRNQDLAMSQIENMPGGYNALRRMYEDVQEPMMDAMSGGGGAAATGGGASTSNNNNSGTGGNGTAGATNQAMPNPWGAPTPSSSSGTNTANNLGSGTGGSAAANPFASMMGGMGGMGGFPNASGGAGAAGASNPWAANPMMGGNNQQNLDATLQMLENPMMNQMMQSMLNNPEQMRMMMDANPMMRQLREQNPQMAAMLDNPDTMRAMLEPNNIRAMAQMQQAMGQLSGSFPGMGLGSMPNPSNTAAPPQGGLDFSSLLGGSGASGGGASGGGAANPIFNNPLYANPGAAANPLFGGLGGGQPSSQPAPGQRFRVQLQNLQDMGFTDRSANIRALTSSHGNVNRAIEILLESPPEMGGSDAAAETNAEAAAESSQVADDAAANSGDSEPKDTTEKKND
ncbi:ubiquilin family protein [Skeletonema marinoi]|uniref:Ubiquilin n=1 Tax=Skeletonema marinoi TaxID=267567 RepID=A0AAD8XZ06_9STRA|nr:ubiquilin family protein [Skeletonema marinoi]